MAEDAAIKTHLHNNQAFDLSIDVLPQGGTKCYDEDGRLKRSGKFHQAVMIWIFLAFCLPFKLFVLGK